MKSYILLISFLLNSSLCLGKDSCDPILYLSEPSILTENSVILFNAVGYSKKVYLNFNTQGCKKKGTTLSENKRRLLAKHVADGLTSFVLSHSKCIVNVADYDRDRRITFVDKKDSCYESPERLIKTTFGPVQEVYVPEDLFNHFKPLPKRDPSSFKKYRKFKQMRKE